MYGIEKIQPPTHFVNIIYYKIGGRVGVVLLMDVNSLANEKSQEYGPMSLSTVRFDVGAKYLNIMY